jgi:hypothetical protein
MLVPEDKKPTEFSMPAMFIVAWAATGIAVPRNPSNRAAEYEVSCRFISSSMKTQH